MTGHLLIFFFLLLPIPELTIAICFKQFCNTNCIYYFGSEEFFLCLENEKDSSCCSTPPPQQFNADCDPGFCNKNCKRYPHSPGSKEIHDACVRSQASSSCCPRPQQFSLYRRSIAISEEEGDTNHNSHRWSRDFEEKSEEMEREYRQRKNEVYSTFTIFLILGCVIAGLCIFVPLCVLGCVYCAARQRRVQPAPYNYPVQYNNLGAYPGYPPPPYGGNTTSTEAVYV